MDNIEPSRFRVLLIPEGVSPHTGYNWARHKLAGMTVEEPGTYYVVSDYSFGTRVDLTKIIGYVEDLHLGPEGLYGWVKFFTNIRQAFETFAAYGIDIKPQLRAGFMLNPVTKEAKVLEFKLVPFA